MSGYSREFMGGPYGDEPEELPREAMPLSVQQRPVNSRELVTVLQVVGEPDAPVEFKGENGYKDIRARRAAGTILGQHFSRVPFDPEDTVNNRRLDRVPFAGSAELVPNVEVRVAEDRLTNQGV